MVICCLPLCTSCSDRGKNIDKYGNKITFHKFPSDPHRRQLWIKTIRQLGKHPAVKLWKPEGNLDRSVICSLHFDSWDFIWSLKMRRLLPDAVPSVLPEYQAYMQSEAKQPKVKIEKVMPVKEETCIKTTGTASAIELQEPEAKITTPVINSLPFQPSNFKPSLNVLCLLPVEPGIIPNYPVCIQSIPTEQKVGSERKESSITKAPCKKTTVTAHAPLNILPEQGSAANKSIKNGKNLDAIAKDCATSVDKCFTYHKLLKSLSLVKKPNQFWGVTPTDKFTIFSRWNEKYIPEKRIIIDNTLNIKVFLGELEINIMSLMELMSAEDVSALLEKVEGVKFFGKEPVIS